jgi:hypothetical protein
MKRIACLIVATLGFSSPLLAQSSYPNSSMSTLLVGDTLQGVPSSFFTTQPAPGVPPIAKTLSLAGPRFGITLLSDDTIVKLHERDIDVNHTISQFGWQFEHEFYSKQDGPTVLNEWVFLLGGMDQGVVIPSLNWLVGLRTRDGAEFGIGPNITPAGVALAVAAGVTLRAGVINVPMTIAAVPSKYGTRVSILTGFVLRH